MTAYMVQRGGASDRTRVERLLHGLDMVQPEVQELIVTAWVSAWRSSPFDDLTDAPYSSLAPRYRLMDHVVDVCRAGLALAGEAADRWGSPVVHDRLVPVLLLHDIDKPLLYQREGETVGRSNLALRLPHGVVGAMLIHDVGLPDEVVDVVATHPTDSPFHGRSFEAYILHYADMFASDHVIMAEGGLPFYRRHH